MGQAVRASGSRTPINSDWTQSFAREPQTLSAQSFNSLNRLAAIISHPSNSAGVWCNRHLTVSSQETPSPTEKFFSTWKTAAWRNIHAPADVLSDHVKSLAQPSWRDPPDKPRADPTSARVVLYKKRRPSSRGTEAVNALLQTRRQRRRRKAMTPPTTTTVRINQRMAFFRLSSGPDPFTSVRRMSAKDSLSSDGFSSRVLLMVLPPFQEFATTLPQIMKIGRRLFLAEHHHWCCDKDA